MNPHIETLIIFLGMIGAYSIGFFSGYSGEKKALLSLKLYLRIGRYLFLLFLGGVVLPWLIQFRFNFLGATLVTLKDVIGLWVGCFVTSFVILFFLWLHRHK